MQGQSAHAQTGPLASKQGLAQQQTTLFAQLFDRPDDLDLMFDYARVSARLEDYESAIATLERALAYNPGVPSIRLELGALYYKVGAYATAEAYFGTAYASGTLTPAQEARVQDYQAQINRRTARSRFSGQISAGTIVSSNANIGPDETTILASGRSATGPDARSDAGIFSRTLIRHDYDLGGADADVWRSDAGLSVIGFFEETGGNLISVAARTGPILSLTPEEYGPKLRPFVDADYVHSGGEALYATLGTGVQYTNTLSDTWFAFGEASVAQRAFFSDFDDEDGTIGRLSLGAAYKPTRDLVLRGQVRLRGDWAERDFNSHIAAGARVEATWRYDPGLPIAGRKWELTGYVDAGFADYDAPEAAVDPDRAREETVMTLGLQNTFHLQDGLFLRAEGLAHRRDANIPNYDLTVYEMRLGVGLEF